jgi:uncharacterized membrane protein
MMVTLAAAFILGVVAGLRAFTAPAIVLLAARDWVAGGIVAVLAAGELFADILPTTPSRTTPVPLVARIVSGAFVGAFVSAGSTSARVIGALVGIAGALIGTFGGHALRLRAIAAIGAIPAALVEDVVAIGLGIAAVTIV